MAVTIEHESAEVVRSEGAWRPLLGGELAQRVESALDRIAAGLPTLPMPRPGSRQATGAAALGSGQAGQALFWAYLARAREDRGDNGQGAANRAEECLDAALEEVACSPLTPTLYGGFPGAGWVEEHLRGLLFDGEQEPEPDDEDLLVEIDEAVLTALDSEPWQGDYDLIRGLVGLGVYAVERLPSPRAERALARVIDHLAASATEIGTAIAWHTDPRLFLPIQRQQYPNGHFNAGVAHGVPGVIALLGAACQVGIREREARRLLNLSTIWLLETEISVDPSPEMSRNRARFPTALVPGIDPEPSRLAWCYGDPGIAAALLTAGLGAGDGRLVEESVRIAKQVADCELAGTAVTDPGLCHGSAGLGHLFNRLYQATGETEFADASRFWFETTLDFMRNDGHTGFFTQVPVSEEELEWAEVGGFLNGVAGIGLALLAAISPLEPAWDRVLLISPPAWPTRTRRP